mgnify:CR=1 FL=1
MNEVGLGASCPQACIRVYVANRPPMEPYEHLESVKPLTQGEVQQIAQHTGNHWRKIFNVYAKFLYSMYSSQQALQVNLHDSQRWQDYRDDILLQVNSCSMLLFSPPTFKKSGPDIHIIMGKQYAAQLGFDRESSEELVILDGDFAICKRKNLIICPYFDYRQLSNIKIERLIALVQELWKKPS